MTTEVPGMVVTIDVVEFRRRRDAFRLLRHSQRALGGQPEFIRALAPARNWRGADLRRVIVLACWRGGLPGALDFGGRAVREAWRGTFDPQRSHGSLYGGDPLQASGGGGSGPGAIFTAGNFSVRRLPAFFRQNLRVVRELEPMPGILTAFGAVGFWRKGPWMCTLSFWADLEDGVDFAYRGSPQHREAVKRQRAGAYGDDETYNARLGLFESAGTIRGRDPFAATEAVQHDFPL